MFVQQYNIYIYHPNIRKLVSGCKNSPPMPSLHKLRQQTIGTIFHTTSAFHFPIFFFSFISLLLYSNKLRHMQVAKKEKKFISLLYLIVYTFYTIFVDQSYFFKLDKTCSAASPSLFRDVTICTMSFEQRVCSVPRFFQY